MKVGSKSSYGVKKLNRVVSFLNIFVQNGTEMLYNKKSIIPLLNTHE